MLDTVRCQWPGLDFGQAFWDWLQAEYVQVSYTTRFYDRGKDSVMSRVPWQGASVKDDVLGTLQVKSNRLGNWLIAEASLPKFMYGDNCRVLSIGETMTGLSCWLAAVEAKFLPWFMEGLDLRSSRKIMRADLCYQQKVPCSTEVFAQIASTLNAKKVVKHQHILCPVEVHLTGVTYHQSMLEHARWYDKGIESGNERYIDVVRHEEQLRRGKSGFLVDVSGEVPQVNVEVAREYLNRRYQGFGPLESYDLGGLMREHGTQGAAAALLVVHPHYEPTYRHNLPLRTFYRVKSLALDARRRLASIDLRLPDDAWREPMVL